MLTKVAFSNFKALANVEVELERLTVLVGANATGKTTVLEGVYLLCEATRQRQVKGLDEFLHERMARKTLSTGCTPGDVTLRAHMLELAKYNFAQVGVPALVELVINSRAEHGDSLAWPETVVPSATRTSFELEKLAAPSHVPKFMADGSGLASTIAALLVNRSPIIDTIQDELRRMVPAARRLRAPMTTITRTENEILTINGREVLNPVERSYNGYQLELELAGTGFIPASLLSEGTLLMIGLLTILHTSPRPQMFLIDDLDRGLHPKAQQLVVDSLRRFVEEHDDVQVLCTSHSPFALDHFRPEEVRVMKADSRGLAHCRKLTDHPDWDYWKDMMKAGEFWSSVGEDWVYGEDSDAG